MNLNDGNRHLTSRGKGSSRSSEEYVSEYFDATSIVDRQPTTEVQAFSDEEAAQYGFKRSPRKTSQNNSGKFSKKKHFKIRVLAGTLAGLLGILAGVIFFAMWYTDHMLDNIVYETRDADAVITIVNEDGNTVVLSDVTQPTRFGLAEDEPVKNFLLIGIDSREKNYNSSGTGDRSDVICIMSVDSRQGSIKLLSIQRDSYAYFPGYTKPHKINAAMSYGGPDLLQATIENCLRIKIDGYAYVNFSNMAKIIDAVGGVYVDMTYDELNVANNYVKEMDPNAALISNTGNAVWLNGVQGVAYARNRYSGNGDYERMERQIEVLRSIMQQYMSLSATKKLACTDEILSCIVTNVDKNDIKKYAVDFLPSMKKAEMQYLQLVIDSCYNCGIYGGEWSMRCNWNAYVPYVQKYFYGKTSDFDEVSVPPYAPDLDKCNTDIPLDQLIH